MKQLFFLLFAITLLISGCSKQKNSSAGNDVNTISATEKVEYKCDGMHCSGCEESITSEVKKLEGVGNVNADSKSKMVTVMFDPSKTDKEKISKAINAAGYDTQLSSSDKKHDCEKDMKDKKD